MAKPKPKKRPAPKRPAPAKQHQAPLSDAMARAQAFIARMPDLSGSLPHHVKASVFYSEVANALMRNPDLILFDPNTVYREISTGASLGLSFNPQLGEASLAIAENFKTKKTEPQLRIGYRGMIKLARQSGEVQTAYAGKICEHDDIEIDDGFPRVFHVRVKDPFNRGDVKGYFAMVTDFHGGFDFELMSMQEIHDIRDRSESWKAYKAAKALNRKSAITNAWETDEGEMAKKTPFRRLMKRMQQSPELARAIQIEDEAEAVIDSGAAYAPRASAFRPPEQARQMPKPPAPGMPIEPTPVQPDPQKHPHAWVQWLDYQLGLIMDGATLQSRWEEFYSRLVKSLPGAFEVDAMNIFFKHEKRFPSSAAAPNSGAVPVADRPPPDNRDGAADLKSKTALAFEIGKLLTVKDCMQWAVDNRKSLDAMADPVRRQIDKALQDRQQEISKKK